jgi:cytochrome b561
MHLRLLLAACVAAAAVPARAELRLLDETLRLDLVVPGALRGPAPDLRALAVIADQQGSGPGDVDLLGEPEKPPPPSADAKKMRLRRSMLSLHQGIGLGLLALQVTTTVVGQLNYNDKFVSSANTNKYKQAHALLAWTNIGVFVVNGTIAVLAPEPPGTMSSGFDRVTLHKVSMFTAAAGMAAQGVLGVYTAQREGYENQKQLATVHLAIGYATLAAMLVGVSALVF